MTTENAGSFSDADLRVEMVDCTPPAEAPAQVLPEAPETSQAQRIAEASLAQTGADPPPEGHQ